MLAIKVFLQTASCSSVHSSFQYGNRNIDSARDSGVVQCIQGKKGRQIIDSSLYNNHIV